MVRTPRDAMSEAELGWAAGILDGEGCIHLYHATALKKYHTYVLQVSISNTSLVLLHRFAEIVGEGRVNRLTRQPAKDTHRQQWVWMVAARKAETVLTMLLPYLVNKRPEAELALRSRALMGKHGVPMKNPNLIELAEIRKRLQEMKRVS